MIFVIMLKVYPKTQAPNSVQSQINGQTGPPYWVPSLLYDLQKQLRRRVMLSPNFIPFQTSVQHKNVSSPNTLGENNGSVSREANSCLADK